MSGEILFSIDLEDVREWVKDGKKYAERVQVNTENYLHFLRENKSKATFFVVGKVAKQFPSMIKTIADEGHEVACHSNEHVQLDKLNPQAFREDLLRNIENLNNACSAEIKGFRAPTFSMTEKTRWAYEVLEDLKFEYSSSVLPAKNPLYGWKEFGTEFKKINKILEMPVTLLPYPFLKVPLAGGVYFRVLPFFLIKNVVKNLFAEKKPLLTYFHPYDIDTEQERFMHPDLNENRLMNSLMYINRSKVFSRLENILESFDATIITYREYLKSHS